MFYKSELSMEKKYDHQLCEAAAQQQWEDAKNLCNGKQSRPIV